MLRLKKDKKTKKIRRGKIIRPIILKALMILLLIGLNWAGFSAVGRTLAYYNDTENSGDNYYQADSLDFSLSSTSDFSPKVTPAYNSTRQISVQNEGDLDFSYSVKVDNFSGDLCDYLNIKDDLNNSFQSLESFVSATTTFSAKNSWLFTVKLTSNDRNLQNKTCVFDFVFSGWQTNFSDSSNGFTDIERIANTVVSTDWTPPEISNIVYLIGSPGESNDLKAIITWDTDENSDSFVDYGLDSNYGNTVGQNDSVVSHSVEISGLSENTTYHFRVKSKDAYGNESVSEDYTFETKGYRLGVPPYSNVVINEFLPNPIGDDNDLAPNGEWVELYNRGSSPVNLSGWFLTDLVFHKLPVPDSVINPGEFLVVYLDGAYSPGWLNNDTDTVSLWAPLNTPFGTVYYLVDSHFYSKYPPFNDTVLENKSFARIPDGSNKWYDPIPTPGAPNRLSDEEEIELGLINNQDTDNGAEDPSETVNENENTGDTGDAESTGNAESVGDTENEEETDTEQLSNDGVNQGEVTFKQDSVISGQDSPGGEDSEETGDVENADVDNGDNEDNNGSEISDTEKVEPEEQGSLDDDSGQGDDNDSQSTNQNEGQNNNQDDNQNDEEN